MRKNNQVKTKPQLMFFEIIREFEKVEFCGKDIVLTFGVTQTSIGERLKRLRRMGLIIQTSPARTSFPQRAAYYKVSSWGHKYLKDQKEKIDKWIEEKEKLS